MRDAQESMLRILGLKKRSLQNRARPSMCRGTAEMKGSVLLSLVVLAGYGYSGEKELASWWDEVLFPITIGGQPKGGRLVLTPPFAPQNKITIETNDKDSTDDVAQRLASAIKGVGWGSAWLVRGSKITVVNLATGFFSMSSSDPGLVVPPAVKSARAFRDEQTGHITLEWALPPGVEKISVLVPPHLCNVCTETRYVDKSRKMEKGIESGSVEYHLVSLDKQGSPGGYLTVTYPGEGKAPRSSGSEGRAQAVKAGEDPEK